MEPTTTAKPGAQPFLSPQEMSHDQLRDWERTGKAPDRDPAGTTSDAPSAEPTADAASAEPVEQVASTDALSKAVTEPAKPEKKAGKKLSAAERAEQIERETSEHEARLQAALKRRREVLDRLADAEREDPKPKQADKQAEAASAAAVPGWKKYASLPDFPKVDDFVGPNALQEFTAAVTAFVGEKIADERANSVFDARSRQSAEMQARDEAFSRRAEQAETHAKAELEADPEILSRIPDRWKDLSPSEYRRPNEPMTRAHFVKDRVTFHSRNPFKLSEWLCADEFAELSRISRLSPDEQIREIAYKDAEFSAGTSRDSTSAESQARVSKAPAPGPTLGRKPAPGADPLKAAIKENDYLTFERLENERVLAKRKAGR